MTETSKPAGWQLRSAPIETWVHDGVECAIANGAGWVNGYVRVPEGHPWHGKDYDDIPADVHGGLTYSGGDWIGFDTAHLGDVWSDEALAELGQPNPHPEYASLKRHLHFRHGGIQWTAAMLRAEVNRLAAQVARGGAE